jgi:LPXTG-motif cell wall-anchored protein
MTQRQVDASLASAAAPAAARAPAAAPAAPTRMAAATPVAAPAAPERQLPKTASLLPLIAAVGSGSTLLGLGLAMLRRRRAA